MARARHIDNPSCTPGRGRRPSRDYHFLGGGAATQLSNDRRVSGERVSGGYALDAGRDRGRAANLLDRRGGNAFSGARSNRRDRRGSRLPRAAVGRCHRGIQTPRERGRRDRAQPAGGGIPGGRVCGEPRGRGRPVTAELSLNRRDRDPRRSCRGRGAGRRCRPRRARVRTRRGPRATGHLGWVRGGRERRESVGNGSWSNCAARAECASWDQTASALSTPRRTCA